jgi:N-acyl-D-amino-acid deacylase
MRALVLGVALLCGPNLLMAQQAYDLLIRNGRIIDGTGSPWYSGDVGIREGKVAAIGRLGDATAKRTIDAAGKVVAPGFIDMLGQSALTILENPSHPSKIFQAITTEITGEGGSAGPLNDSIIAADQASYDHLKITPDWRTLGQYFARLERQGMGINLASYVGATQVRRVVLGDSNRTPNAEELERMKALVRDGMRDGAVGVSTALQYPPAPYAKTEELIALATEASKLGGMYATHLRSEENEIGPALDEAIRIGREADIPVEIWHIKVAGRRNWGRMPAVVAKIDSARRAGIDIAADTYAYPAWFNSMSAFVPPWAHDGGEAGMIERLRDPALRRRIRREMLAPGKGWDNEWQEIPGAEAVLIGAVQNPALVSYQGKRLSEVAKLRKTDPIETILDLLIED